MKSETRSKYAEYIAEAIRFAQKEAKLTFPEETILIVKSYGPLAELDEIIGLKIFVSDISSSDDFFIAFPSENIGQYKLQKYFKEYLDLYLLALGD